MTSKLHNLAGPGKSLAAEPFDPAEFIGLVKSATVRLRDAANTSLALESRFDLAYNSAHALSLGALRAHGLSEKNNLTPHVKRDTLWKHGNAFNVSIVDYH